MTYVDTSVLFSLYVPDANSARADAWRQNHTDAIVFSRFHRVELRNALSLAVFQQRITLAESEAAWTEILSDLKAGLLVSKGEMWSRFAKKAEAVAKDQTPTIGARSLDVLHVGAALAMGATDFCTFDLRQGKLAAQMGLRLRP